MATAVAAVVDGGAGNKMFIAIDVTTSPIEAPRTISGLILTPSVSSSKNLRRPALDAGSGLPFFLLIAFSLSPCGRPFKICCDGYESNNFTKTIISDAGSCAS